MFSVITENDISQWDDQTGKLYHFPKRYLKFLQPGTSVIYYKGKLKDKEYRNLRLTEKPHYFGVARVGQIFPDPKKTGKHFCTIVNYTSFGPPVFAKNNDGFIEVIPANRESNYWRDGVRPITEEVYRQIISRTLVEEVELSEANSNSLEPGEYESYQEGDPKQRFTTVYERNPLLRQKAVEIHGTTCQACGFNFNEFYGKQGEGYIHVHHLRPISDVKAKSFVNPATDLCVLCPNCHAMIHRSKKETLSLEQLKEKIREAKEQKVLEAI